MTPSPTRFSWDTSHTLIDTLESALARFGELPAYSQEGQTITYADMLKLSRSIAAYLQNHADLKAGDRVAVQLPNTLLYPVLVWAILQAGLVVVNVNPQYTQTETERQLRDADVRAWFCGDISAHLIADVRKSLNCPLIVVCRLFDLHPWMQRNVYQFVLRYKRKAIKPYASHNIVSFRSVLRSADGSKWIKPKTKPEDLAMLQYTGGSSGTHMGAMLTHANLVANMQQVNQFLSTTIEPGKEVLIAPLPIYHIFSFTVHCAVALLAGSHNILILDASSIPSVVAAMKRWKFTSVTGVNTLFFALMRLSSFREIDFRSLKFSIAGGMKLDPAVAQKWQEMTGTPILEGFGMSELSPVASWNPKSDNRIGTIGKAMPETEMRITDAEDRTITSFDESGELWVKGPQVMKGYWRKDKETAHHLSEGGWMRTGDLARQDKDGYWTITGRKKRMILVSGFNVYPQEIEAVLLTHPEITGATVVGRMHPINGESVKAYVLSKKQDLTMAELRDYCRKYLTSYKIPKQIEIVDTLPSPAP